MFSFITKPIGCLFSLVGSIVVIALVLVIAVLGLLSYFMPQIGAKAITEATGFPTTIGSSSLSLWHQRLDLRDIRINNPETYPEDDFLAISSLSLKLDRKASTQEHLVLSEVTLAIDTLTLVRLSGTVLNGSAIIRNLLLNIPLNPSGSASEQTTLPEYAAINSYTAGQQPNAAPAANELVRFIPPTAPTGSNIPALSPVPITYDAEGKPSHGERPKWLIRQLNITIDSVRLFESAPHGNFLQLVPLRYQRTFNNVTSLQQVLPALLLELQRRGLPL